MNCVDVRVIDNKDLADIRVFSCLKLTLPVIFLLAFMLPGLSQYSGTSFEQARVAKRFLQSADSTKIYSSVIKSRRWIVAGGHAVTWAGTFIALNKAWYRDYPRSGFHFFDDRKEWNQVDKLGHIWTSYQLSRHSAATWQWSGYNSTQSAWLGGASAFAFQSIIEILDGFSDEWGFSIGDMEANLMGSAGFVAQELLFKSQIVQVKVGYKPYDYPPDLKSRRDKLFGSSLPEQILKDYNSQRYWLTANIKNIFPSSSFPGWLNIAAGYSSDGLYGGRENVWNDNQGNYFDRRDIRRIRRFYISPDIDFTKIKTNNKFLRSVFFVLNIIKIPAPAIEYNTTRKLRLHALLF